MCQQYQTAQHAVTPATVKADIISLLLGGDAQPGTTARALTAVGNGNLPFCICAQCFESSIEMTFS